MESDLTIEIESVRKAREAEEAAKPLEQRQKEFRETHQHYWTKNPEGRLCQQFYKAYIEYRSFLEECGRPPRHGNDQGIDFLEHQVYEEMARRVEQFRAQEQEATEKKRENLEKARVAARCEHVLADGQRCRCPKMKESRLCYWHDHMEKTKAAKLDLGPMEDPDSIQMAIRKLQVAVIDSSLEQRQISQLAYLIQLAAWNVTRTRIAAKIAPKETPED